MSPDDLFRSVLAARAVQEELAELEGVAVEVELELRFEAVVAGGEAARRAIRERVDAVRRRYPGVSMRLGIRAK